MPPFEQAEVYAGSLPQVGFRPTDVVRCVVADSATQRDDGSMIYRISQETGTLTTELVQRLRWPDSAPPTRPNAACDASARPILYLLLVDTTGRGYRPRIPLDWCGEPRPEVTQAVQAVEWRTTGTYEVTRS
ncbi:hypothetical protein [Microlunatus sp. GCM10028923]|uniref:hypothetical protein n=1 Tax=Microlunatus sp. GCM10028923 TaxID=3273400 RepID=UPI003616EF05